MRRIGATCTAAQRYTRSKDMPIPEYDRNGVGIRRRRRVPVGMATIASHRPIARVAAGGSARFRLLTCDRRHRHTVSAKICAIFRRHERQAPIIRSATEGGDFEAGRRAGKNSERRRYEWVSAAESRSFCTEDRAGRVAPANTACRQGSEGRCHGTSKARKGRSIRSPPGRYGRSGAESPRQNHCPPPSNYTIDRTKKRRGVITRGFKRAHIVN